MLKITGAVLIAAGIIGGMASTASAAQHTQYRLDRQAAQIEQGRKTGTITWTEGVKLRNEQRDIARLKARYLANDGRLSAAEKRVLNKKLDVAKRNIAVKKVNNHKRWKPLPRVGR